MRASFRHVCRKGDTLHVDLAGEGSNLIGSLAQWKNVVAHNGVMVGGAGLSLLHVRAVGIVCQTAYLHTRLDELVDGHIHVELQESRDIYVELRTHCRDTLLENPVVEECRAWAGDVILVLNDAASLHIGHYHMHNGIVFIYSLLYKRAGVDIPPLHLTLFVLGENPYLQVGQLVEELAVVGIEVDNVDIGMAGTLWLQNLCAQTELIVDQDATLVDIILAKIRNVVSTDIRTVFVVIIHLIRNLIRGLHRLAQDNGIGIDSITPAVEFPFHARRLAKFLVRQLGISHICTGKKRYYK